MDTIGFKDAKNGKHGKHGYAIFLNKKKGDKGRAARFV